MRYTRLRRQIESGTLIGTHGTPFTGAPEKIAEAGKKRKGGTSSSGGGHAKFHDDGASEDGNEDGEGHDGSSGEKSSERVGGEKRVKREAGGFASDTTSDDSEDEVPLAKLRKTRGEDARREMLEQHPVVMAPLFPMPRLEAFVGGAGNNHNHNGERSGGGGCKGEWPVGDARKEMERMRGVDYFPDVAKREQ